MADNPPDEEVPPGWHRWYSERRKKFYYHNDATGEVQWTLPKIEGDAIASTVETKVIPEPRSGGGSSNSSVSTPTAAGQGASAVRSLTVPNTSHVPAGGASSPAAAAEEDDPASYAAPAGGGVSSSETVGLLQSLFPYYSYDDNTARLVKLTIPSVPGVDIDGRDEFGNTLLLLAVQYKAHDVMEQLVDLGADVNARNYSGSCCLHYACHYETFDENTVRMLVGRGAKTTFAEEAAQGGLTPLHYAAETGHVEVCRFLVSKGADASKRDAYGRTASDCARDAEQAECADAFASFQVAIRTPAKVGGASAVSVLASPTGRDDGAVVGGGGGGLVIGGGVSAGGGPGWGFGEDAAEIKEALFKIQADLQRSLTSKEAQRQEYETLLKEKDMALLGSRDQLAKAQSDTRASSVKLEHGRLDVDVLERRVAELATQLSACESRSDEDRRGRIATAGRLERKVVDLEGQLAAERQRVEHEGELREQASQELGREKDHAALAMAEHLRVVRDGATASVQLAQVTERCSGHERETERLKERAVELEERLDATKQKGEQVRTEMATHRQAAAVAAARAEASSQAADEAVAALEVERERGRKVVEVLDELRSDSGGMRQELAAMGDLLRLQQKQLQQHELDKQEQQEKQEQLQQQRTAEADASSKDLAEVLAASRVEAKMLQAEVDRLRAAESASLFGDASRIAVELGALKAENARLAAQHDDSQKQAKQQQQQAQQHAQAQQQQQLVELKQQQQVESSALAACKRDNEVLRQELQEARGKLLHKASASEMLAAKLSSEQSAGASEKVTELEMQKQSLLKKLTSMKERALTAEAKADEASASALAHGSSAEDVAAALADAKSKAKGDAKRAADEARAAAIAEAAQQTAALKESHALALSETSRTHATELDTQRRKFSALEQQARAAAAEAETRVKALATKLSEQAEAAEAEARRVQRTHDLEVETLKEQHNREVQALRRQLVDEREQSKATIDDLDKRRAAAEAESAEVRREAEAEARKAAGQLREASEAREVAEVKVREMAEAIEEAKVVDQRNAILDARMGVEIERRRKLHEYVEDLKGRIRVYVRVRPMSETEQNRGCASSYTKNHDTSLTYFQPDKQPPEDKKSFDFDKVFAGGDGDGNAQENVFNDLRGLVLSCVEGKNVCIFAYGQTGSGKTFSMVGPDGSIGGNIDMTLLKGGGPASGGSSSTPAPQPHALAGVTPRAIVELFSVLEERDALNVGEVDVSMYELYCDSLVDLLGTNVKRARDKQEGASNKAPALNIKLAQHTTSGLVEVEGGTVRRTTSMVELIEVMEQGVKARSTSATAMNAESSRSHLIMMMVVRSTNRRSGETVFGKLTLVDLAGSERVDKSGAEGQRLKEAASINKSLSAIGDVVSALTTNNKHIPYRSHALTTLMSDSIGGSAKTVMVVCCSPADYNTKESLSALGFAKRCKNVKNAANPAQAAAQVQALKAELDRLKNANAAKVKAPDQRPMTTRGGQPPAASPYRR